MFSIKEPVMAERIGEVFANLLDHLFVFGSDSRTFLLHRLGDYSQSLTSVGDNDRDTAIRFIELLIRLFVVADAVSSQTEPGTQPRSWSADYEPLAGGDLEQAWTRFTKMLDDVGYMFWAYEVMWRGPKADQVERLLRDQFVEIYPRTLRYMPEVWAKAIDVYGRFVEQTFGSGGAYKRVLDAIDKDIETGLEQGRPLMRCLIGEGAIWGSQAHRPPLGAEGPGLDPLALVCRILYHYAAPIGGTKGKRPHLHRSFRSGEVDYPTAERRDMKVADCRKWNDFQMFQGAAAMFCPVPKARRWRLRRQIAILKTCWDISANFRTRRLWDIICTILPESRDWFTEAPNQAAD